MRVRTGPEVKVSRQTSSMYKAPFVGSHVRQSSQARRKSAMKSEGLERVKETPAGFTCTVTLV